MSHDLAAYLTFVSAWIFPVMALIAALATLVSLVGFIRNVYRDRAGTE